VTVLAGNAALADAVATVVANAVDLPDHPAIERRPASSLRDDSDLGERLVTYRVDRLGDLDVEAALAAGQRCADDAVARHDAIAVFLSLRGRRRVAGAAPELAPAATGRPSPLDG